MSSPSSHKLSLHFNLSNISASDVPNLANDWHKMYALNSYEAVWNVIQLIVDSTGNSGTSFDYLSTDFSGKHMQSIIEKIPMNFSYHNFILRSDPFRDNLLNFLGCIIHRNRLDTDFVTLNLDYIMCFAFKLISNRREIYFTTAAYYLLGITFHLYETIQYFDLDKNHVTALISKHEAQVFGCIEECFNFEDAALVMSQLFMKTFSKHYSLFTLNTDMKNIFTKMLMIDNSKNIYAALCLIETVILEKNHPSVQFNILKMVNSNETMVVLMQHVINPIKYISLKAHGIINLLLRVREEIGLHCPNIIKLQLRMYNKCPKIRKLASTTFTIMNPNNDRVEEMIQFYLAYPDPDANLKYLVDSCLQAHDSCYACPKFISFIIGRDKLDAERIVAVQMLLQFFKLHVNECVNVISTFMKHLPKLYEKTKRLPIITLNLLQILELIDSQEHDNKSIIPVISLLEKLVLNNKEYDILCAANQNMDYYMIQHEDLFDDRLPAEIINLIFAHYKRCRELLIENITAEKVKNFKHALVRVRATAEQNWHILDYFNESTLNDILDIFLCDIITPKENVDGTFLEHQIIIYTTISIAMFNKEGENDHEKRIAMVERLIPFLQHLISLLADTNTNEKENSILTNAILPGILKFYLMSAVPIDPPRDNNCFQKIPSYVYSNIGLALYNLSCNITKENMNVMQNLLHYWVCLHKLQHCPVCPEANKIIILYGNVEELSETFENFIIELYKTPDHILLISVIGYSILALHRIDKTISRNYTTKLYKFITQKTNKFVGLPDLFAPIILYVLCKLEVTLKSVAIPNHNRLEVLRYLHNFVAFIKVKRTNNDIINQANGMLKIETVSQQEIKQLTTLLSALSC